VTRILVIIIIAVKGQGVGGRVPWGRFWVQQSKGALSVLPLSRCLWTTAWVGCSLLASPRASAVTCCGATLVLLVSPFCTAVFYDPVWNWVAWVQSAWPY